MKKALIVLLILAIAGGAFAQELTWNGAVKTGLKIVADDAHNGEDITAEFYSDDAEVPLRLDLNGAYTNNNYGIVFRLRADPAGFATPAGGVAGGLWEVAHQAYGWITFVDEIIKVSAGKIDDGTWKTGGLENYGVNGTGIRIEIAPITGLNLGIMLRAPTDVTNTTFKNFLSETAFGAKYESDLFWVAGALLLDSTADGLEGLGDDLGVKGAGNPLGNLPAGAVDSDHGLVFQAGAGVKPIPGLEVSIEGKAYNASKFADYGYFVLDEKVGYKLLSDKLEVGLKSYQYFFGKDWSKGINFSGPGYNADPDASLKPYIELTPYVSYDVLDTLNVGVSATIGFLKDTIDYYFGLKPSLTYKVAEKAKIVAFYNFEALNFYEDMEIADRKSNKSNTIQIDMIWEF
jgi:hypothetical protein